LHRGKAREQLFDFNASRDDHGCDIDVEGWRMMNRLFGTLMNQEIGPEDFRKEDLGYLFGRF